MERQLASLMTGQWVVVLWVVLPDLWETVKDEQLASLKMGKGVVGGIDGAGVSMHELGLQRQSSGNSDATFLHAPVSV